MKNNKNSATVDGYDVTHSSLLHELQQGSQIAYERFYRIYSPLVRIRGRAYSLSSSEIDDLVQDVMVAFFDKDKNFVYNSERRFRNYFYGIIKYHIFAVYRKKKRHSEIFANVPEDMNIEDLGDFQWPEEPNEKQEWQDYIHNKAIAELREIFKKKLVTVQVFLLLLEQQYSPQEIAKSLSISLSSVYNHKAEAIREYRRIVRNLNELQ